MKFSPLISALLVLALIASSAQVYADPLKNAYTQRIGNYDVQMTTEPKNPIVGSPINVMLRIAGVNGDDLVDIPITLRLVKDGVEIQRINQIVPYGHYTHEFTFAQIGRYVLYLDINDNSYSGQTLTFTFFVNVAGPFDYLYVAVPSSAIIAVGIAGTLVILKKRRKQILK